MKTRAELIAMAETQASRYLMSFVAQGRWSVRLRFAEDTGDHAAANHARKRLARANSGIDYNFGRFMITVRVLGERGDAAIALKLLKTWSRRANNAGHRAYAVESSRLFNAIPAASRAVAFAEMPGLAHEVAA